MKHSLEHSYRIALAMSEDEKADIGERLEALNKKDDSRLSLIHLLSEFPDFISQRKISSSNIMFEQPLEESPSQDAASTLKLVHS